MQFLTDQDVYYSTVLKLRQWGHDVLTAHQIGMARASDQELLEKSVQTGRIFITRDKDFGALMFLYEKESNGVILLRMSPSDMDNVHAVLAKILQKYSFQDLKQFFCVVEADKYRIRKLV
jgi:predicted nuclease of predicted toxin-antitoxin system